MTGYNLTLQRPKLQSAVLKFFVAEEFNFEAETLLGTGVMNSTGQFADVGTVVGKITTAAPAAAAGAATAGNTGNGTMGTPSAVAASAQVGTYTVDYIAPLRFNVYDPAGKLVGEGVNGTAFLNQVGFTMTAGGTAFAAGDSFTIAVTEAAGAGQCTIVNPSATDGSQNAMGVVMRACTANAGADNVAGLVVLERGPAVVLSDNLVFPSGSSAYQAAWLAQLLALGIVTRAS